jgi:hypothetical protein
MNGDNINRVKDGPFLDKKKNATKGPQGKDATKESPKAAV